jgi:hypothetical protein
MTWWHFAFVKNISVISFFYDFEKQNWGPFKKKTPLDFCGPIRF